MMEFIRTICGRRIARGLLVWLNDHPAHWPECPVGHLRAAVGQGTGQVTPNPYPDGGEPEIEQERRLRG
jgi:hypothetical protein